MSKSMRQANRKAAIFSATLLGTTLILAVFFTSDPLQKVEAQQLSANAQMLALSDDTMLPDEDDEIADMFEAPAREAELLD